MEPRGEGSGPSGSRRRPGPDVWVVVAWWVVVAVLGDKTAGALERTVMQRYAVAVPRQVAGQVAAHHGQPSDADLRGSPVIAHTHSVSESSPEVNGLLVKLS